MTTNNKISTVVSSQLPEFVRSDHPTFIAFVKAYYEYLEQSNTILSYGKTVERAKNLTKYFDTDKITDTGLTEFNDHLYNEFLTLIPKEVSSDKSKLLKNIKDFYRAKGTEKSYNFFFRLLFNEDPELYYPKNDILIASSGKWLVEQSIRLSNIEINEIVDDSIINLKKFESTKVVGNTSQASAFVERIFVSYESGTKINEFFISNKNGNFISGEQVFIKNANNETLSADILSGFISSVALTNGGSGYTIGTSIPVVGGGGSGGSVIISDVSSGNISNVSIISGGAGFRVSDFVLFSGGGGAGANANVIQVLTDNSVHPNTYNINSDVINTYNLTAIGAYSNSSGGNANTSLLTTLTYFEYANTGPIYLVALNDPGAGYNILSTTAEASGNSMIKALGIIGRLKINSAGSGYSNNAKIIFTNVVGGYGFGANAKAIVNASGSIIRTELTPYTTDSGHIVGGFGYDANAFPILSIEGAGVDANITVEALLGDGDVLTPLAYAITQNTDGNIIRITAKNAANLPLLELTTNTSTLIFKNTWNHFVATWDLSSNSACKVYLNDINSTKLDSINFGQIDYTGSNVSIGSEPNLTRSYRGCLSEFWFSNNYADIANTTIRTFFIGANGVLLPSNMQASNGYMGRVNLNITPSIYLKSNGLFANTNSGIANNFTFANNITNCSNTSSEPA